MPKDPARTLTVFVTKYALTQGILEMNVNPSYNYPNMVTEAGNSLNTIHKPFWYVDRHHAVIHAEEMRNKKIKSVEKQLKKLRTMKF